MNYLKLDDLWEQHKMAKAVSDNAFNVYMDSLGAPRTQRRNAASKECEAAYTSAKAVETEILKKITDMT